METQLQNKAREIAVFIDGSAGTTGLRLRERLTHRRGLRWICLSEEERKDPACRRRALNEADVAFLCLPDAAAVEAADWVESDHTVLIDASTAHRTHPDWAYGFPELSEAHRAAVCAGRRIAVPGCHASGFIALVYPLIQGGLLDPSTLLTCQSLTGYSGGGKAMIADYRVPQAQRSPLLEAPRLYGLGQRHKHLPEMKAVTGLSHEPIFCPVVADFYSGMQVTVPLFAHQLAAGYGIEDVKDAYRRAYSGPGVTYCDAPDEGGFLSAAAMTGKDTMKVAVYGHEERILLTAVYDNLGKGASGAALECFNLIIGADPMEGLVE